MTNGMGALGGLIGLGVTVVAAKAVIDTTQELATGKKKKGAKKKAVDTLGGDVTTRALNKMLGKY